jgi:predicted transcriptional regulator
MILKHRTKEEIAALILESIVHTNRATQTIIMYKAYLTHVQLKQFLSSLMEKGLIEYHKEDRLYTITEKGMHFLEIYNQLNQLHTSNMFNIAREFQTIEPTQVADEHEIGQSSYLAVYNNNNNNKQRTQANLHRWKCEKCLRLFANHKELKLHKVEYHSY